MIMAEESIEAVKEAAPVQAQKEQETAAPATAPVKKAAVKMAPRAKRTSPAVAGAGTAASRKKQKVRAILVHAKRKEAVARAAISEGHGSIRINGFDISTMQQKEMVSLVMEPIRMSDITAELAAKMDISVKVSGGGFSAQMQAARNAIAKGIIEYTGSDSIRKLYAAHNKYLLTNDYRRVEPKKYKGPKARARFQTSYR